MAECITSKCECTRLKAVGGKFLSCFFLNQSLNPIPAVLLSEFEVCWCHCFVQCVLLLLKVLSTKQYKTNNTIYFEIFDCASQVVNSVLLCEPPLVQNRLCTIYGRAFLIACMTCEGIRIGYCY